MFGHTGVNPLELIVVAAIILTSIGLPIAIGVRLLVKIFGRKKQPPNR